MKIIGTSQKGFVALPVAALVSLLLMVSTVSAVGLAVNETRQATDSDQAVRAYYAAEAGVEDAVLRIKDNISPSGVLAESVVNRDCTGPNGSATLTNGTSYTCQKITQTINALTGALAQEQPVQISATEFTKLTISWDLPADSVTRAPGSTPLFPPNPGQPWTYPAALEFSIINYKSGDVNSDQKNFGIKTAVLKPDINGDVIDLADIRPATSKTPTRCGGGSSYSCKMDITGFDPRPGYYYILRFRPRYAGTHYKLQFFNGSTPVEVTDQFATVDVTAKAGNVFRRVVAKIEIKQGVASGLDYVLFSDNDICKQFEVDKFDTTDITGCPF